MRWFIANGSSFNSKPHNVHYGTLVEPIAERSREQYMRTALLKTPDSQWSIGFKASQAILIEFDKIEYGSYVRMEFGVTLANHHDRFINRLISFQIIDLMDEPRIEGENF